VWVQQAIVGRHWPEQCNSNVQLIYKLDMNLKRQQINTRTESVEKVYACNYMHEILTWLGPYMRSKHIISLYSSRQRLRSSSTLQLNVHPARLATAGDRAFNVAAARLWNRLPPDITAGQTLFQFRRRFKTYFLIYLFLLVSHAYIVCQACFAHTDFN
jgi:hypothetical protein